MKEMLARWLLFSVAVALVPILCSYVFKLTFPQAGISATFSATIIHGELLLISVALAADALGDLITADKTRDFLTTVAGGGCVISMLFASLYFAGLSNQETVSANSTVVVRVSIGVFFTTLISAGMCKILAKI